MLDPYRPPNTEDVEDDPSPTDDLGMSERGIGVIALIASGVFIYLGYVSPLYDAISRAPSVKISMTCAGMAPMVLGLGLTYAILGDRAERYLGSRHSPSMGGRVFYLALFIIGIAGYFTLREMIRSYGYNV